MNRVSRGIDWPFLLVDCITGACAGLLVGLLLPVGQVAENIVNGLQVGPGQSAIIGGAFGVLFGVVFFFARSDTGEHEKTPSITYDPQPSVGGYTISIVSAILILTVVIQVMLVKSWT